MSPRPIPVTHASGRAPRPCDARIYTTQASLHRAYIAGQRRRPIRRHLVVSNHVVWRSTGLRRTSKEHGGTPRQYSCLDTHGAVRTSSPRRPHRTTPQALSSRPLDGVRSKDRDPRRRTTTVNHSPPPPHIRVSRLGTRVSLRATTHACTCGDRGTRFAAHPGPLARHHWQMDGLPRARHR